MKSPAPRATAAPATETPAVVTVGRILHFRVSKSVADAINPLRATDAAAHRGKKVHAGDVLPLLVTDVDKDGFSGQVFFDGNDAMWIEHTSIGDDEGQCAWPKG